MTQLNREEKGQVVAGVVERLERTEAVVTADFRGLTVAELAELRGKLREADAEMTVIKNTLSRRAADQTGRSALLPYLQGPTGLVWINGDPARAAKALSDFAKAHEDVFTIRGGVLGQDDLPTQSILKLASLPSREQMLAQLAGGMIAPIAGLAGGMNALLSTFARALAAVRDSGALAPGETPQAEAPAAEADTEAPPAEEPAAAEADASVEAEPSVEDPAAADVEAPVEDASAEEEAPAAEAPADDAAPAEVDDTSAETSADEVEASSAEASVGDADEPGSADAEASAADAETPEAEPAQDAPEGESENPES